MVYIRTRGGEFKHLVSIETPTNSTDGGGGYTESWAQTYTAWCKIIPVKVEQDLRADESGEQITHRIQTWWQSGVTNKMRVVYGSRTFNIVGVRNIDEENREMELLVVEGVPT